MNENKIDENVIDLEGNMLIKENPITKSINIFI